MTDDLADRIAARLSNAELNVLANIVCGLPVSTGAYGKPLPADDVQWLTTNLSGAGLIPHALIVLRDGTWTLTDEGRAVVRALSGGAPS